MALELPIKEKLKLMEALWVDMSKRAEINSPGWHEDALAGTAARLAGGSEEILEWGEAKRRLLNDR